MAMKEISRTRVYENPWYGVDRHDVVDPHGVEHEYFVVAKGDFVAVIAFDGERVPLVELSRVPIGHRSLELPEGGVDGTEDPASAAARELREETGLIAGNIESVGFFYECNGICDARAHVFLATELTLGETARDPFEEDMELSWWTPSEVDALMGTRIKDGPSIAAWAMARARLRELEV